MQLVAARDLLENHDAQVYVGCTATGLGCGFIAYMPRTQRYWAQACCDSVTKFGNYIIHEIMDYRDKEAPRIKNELAEKSKVRVACSTPSQAKAKE
jgi:hypothetical protein